MVSQLYETLGVSRDASNEEIRKAYKKRALQTHPDRLPPGASAADKTNAEEQFRKVNNAYEVLTDEQKRKDYDRFGVWPPPESGPSTPFSGDQYGTGRHRSSREQRSPFDDPFFHEPMFSPSGFFDSPFSRPRQRRPEFMFTDPFALFEALLGDHRRAFHEPFMDDMLSSSPLLFDPLSHRSLFGPSLFDRTSTFPGFNSLEGPSSWNDDHHRNQSASYRSLSYGGFGRGANGGNNWVSESHTTRTVNGVTETIWKRRDIDGNEHVTHFSPDGRERYYINGVDQSSHGATNRSIPPPPASAERGIPPPVPPVDRSIPPPPYPGDTIRQHSPTRKRERSSTRQYNENYAHQGNPVNGDAHSRKRWWRGQW